MVDRGGLNYPIRVKDEFSKTTTLFRKELRASKKEFQDFQKALKGQKASADNIRAMAKATRELAAAQKSLATNARKAKKPLTEQEQALKNLAERAKAQKAREREAVRIRNTQTRDLAKRNAQLAREAKALAGVSREQDRLNKARRATNPALVAEDKVNAALFKQKVLIQEIALLRKAGSAQIAGGDITGGQATLRSADKLEKSLKGSAKQANNILFTFRRLVGTLAIFTLARRGVQTFNELVASGVKFNDTVETAELGIAGLVATLGDVRNGFGESVDTVEELNLALGIAQEQTALLRQDSLKTVATFGQLLDTFQVSVGPGLAAGLNLDEVRQLTVDISQAAAALGVPQNQLAEEVRSLLSGTIQARTTRIATALGISNEDVRRLKETGELFNFLEEQFAGFAEAAERQSRETLSGISTLVKGIVEELLGNAAEPLFEELLDLGNQLFDQVLSFSDEAGNIKPNPEVVEAFQEIFDALKAAVVAAREFGEDLGFEGLQTALGGVGAALQAAVGFLEVMGGAFNTVLDIITAIVGEMSFLNDTTDSVGKRFGRIIGSLVIVNQLTKLISINMLKTVAPVAIVVAGFAALAKSVEFLLEQIFGVNLNIKDTIELVALGLFGAFISTVEVVQTLGEEISKNLANSIDALITTLKNKARGARAVIAELFGDSAESQRLAAESEAEQLASENRIRARKTEAKLAIADIKDQAAAKQKALEDEIAGIIAKRAAEGNQGAGADVGFFDPKKSADEALKAAQTFVSTASKPVSELGEALIKVNDELLKAKDGFKRAGQAGGLGGQVSNIFAEQDFALAQQTEKVRANLTQEEDLIRLREASGVSLERELDILDALTQNVEDRKQAVADLNVVEGEGGLVSALRDQLLIQTKLSEAEQQALDLATLKAGTIAREILPQLMEETALLRAQVEAEQAVTAAAQGGASARSRAVIEATNALNIAQRERQVTQDRTTGELELLQSRLETLDASTEEAEALREALEALRERLILEGLITDAQIERLKLAKEAAVTEEGGSFSDGIQAGLVQLRDELPNIFESAMELTKSIVTSFSQFAASSIVNAIVNAQKEGVDSSDLFREAAAQFAQQLATQILQQGIDVLLQGLLEEVLGQTAELTTATAAATIKTTAATTAAAAGIGAASTAAGIQAAAAIESAAVLIAAAKAAALINSGKGLHSGGLVEGFNSGGYVGRKNSMATLAHNGPQAQGLASGGRPKRPAGIHPSDTVPTWLTPGEFVIRKSSVDSIGLGPLMAMNQGSFGVVGAAAASAGPSAGMASGGLVSDQIQNSQPQDGEGGTVVLPAIVAKERDMDRLVNGGKTAMLGFMRENAGNINALLNRGKRG